MSSFTQEKLDLLYKILELSIIDEDDDPKLSVSKILNDILTNYDYSGDKRHINEYTDLKLVRYFEINRTSDTFNLENISEWIQLVSIDDRILDQKGNYENGNSLTLAIILQVIISLSLLSTINIQRLSRVSKFRGCLLQNLLNNFDNIPQYLRAKYVELYSMLSLIQTDTKDILQLYEELPCDYAFDILECISSKLCHRSFQNYILFDNGYHNIKLKKSNGKYDQILTIQLWIEFNNISSNKILTLGRNIFLQIKKSKLCIANDEYILALFDNYSFEANTLYHISISRYYNEWTLFVNNDEINKIELFESCFSKLTVIEIGSMICSFQLYDLKIWNALLPIELVRLTNHIKFGQSLLMNPNDSIFTAISRIDPNFLERLYHLENHPALSFKDYSERANKLNTSELLFEYNIKEVISQHMDPFTYQLHFLNSDSDIVVGKCFFLKNISIQSHFLSIDCFGLLLENIQTSTSIEICFHHLQHLFQLLNDPLLNEYFTENITFELLAYILYEKVTKKYQSPLPMNFLNLFLNHCGWDFEEIENSMIRNISAFESLILHFNLWVPEIPETLKKYNKIAGLESSICILDKLVYLQCTSRFDRYNTTQLSNLEVLRKVCYFLHSNSGLDLISLEVPIIKFLESCLLHDPTNTNLAFLLHFIFLLSVRKDFKNTRIFLRAIKTLYIDAYKREDISQIKCLVNIFPSKIILLLLDELAENYDAIMDTIQILLLTISYDKASYNTFISNKGIKILVNIVMKCNTGHYFLLIEKFLFYSLGDDLGLYNKTSFPEASPSSNTLGKIRIEFTYLAIVLLEYAVLNDINISSEFGLEKFIIECIEYMVEANKALNIFNLHYTHTLKLLSDFLITLKRVQNGDIYVESTILITEILSTEMIFALGHSQNIDLVIDEICGILNSKTKGNITFQEYKYLDLSFFKFILPNITSKLLREREESINEFLLKNLIALLGKFKNYFIVSKLEFSFINNIYELLFLSLENIVKISRSPELIKSSFDVLNYYLYFFCLSVLNNSWSWDTNEKKSFMRNILIYQGIIFGCDANRDIKEIRQSILYSLISDLCTGGYESETISCIRTVISFGQAELNSLLLPEMSDHHSYTFMLESFLVSNDEEITKNLQAITERFLVKSFTKSFREFLCKEMNINKAYRILDAQHFMNKIFERKEISITFFLNDMKYTQSIFLKDKEIIENKVIVYTLNPFNNYWTDVEEEIKIQRNKLFKFNFVFSHLHAKLWKKEGNSLWMISNGENNERMRTKLIPYFDPRRIGDTIEELSQKNTNITITPALSDRKPNDDITSYEMTSDFVQVNSDLFMNNENRKVLKMLNKSDNIRHIWNGSFVLGLDIVEGIVILGQQYLYYISDFYFCNKRKEIFNITDVPKDKRDPNIDLISGNQGIDASRLTTNFVYQWKLPDLIYIIKKPFLLRDMALELLSEGKNSVFLCFENKNIRDKVYQELFKCSNPKSVDPVLLSTFRELSRYGNHIRSSNGIAKTNLSTRFASVLSPNNHLIDHFEATKLWQLGKISNFFYLVILNTLAGRTMNDLTQYPVFPWVLTDYSSSELDLDNPKSYRELSKPMGAQDEKRKLQFIERYKALEDLNDDKSPPFHYGTHYSSAMIVSSYLVRLKPFSDSFLILQDGSFGYPDRLFNSVSRTWASASKENTTDVRELTPEFFYLPDFLINTNNYKFGKNQSGSEVDDVILPPWAKNDPKLFIKKNREALESKYVTEHLHEWIDLIFGFKQKGQNAVDAVNIFNYLSYPGAVNIANIKDEDERRAITGIIHNFGQIPLQLFQEPHPMKIFQQTIDLRTFSWKSLKLGTIEKHEIMRDQIRYLYGRKDHSGTIIWEGFPFIDIATKNLSLKLVSDVSIIMNGNKFSNIHPTRITAFCIWRKYMLITGDRTGLIKLWKFETIKSTTNLTCVEYMHAHLTEIIDIKTYEDCNILVTLDCEGHVYTWDMDSYRPIRRISSIGRMIAISNTNGNIAVVTKQNNLEVFNMNGSFFTRISLSASEVPTEIASMTFLELFDDGMPMISLPTSVKEKENRTHAYFKNIDYIFIGQEVGCVDIYGLFDGDGPAAWQLSRVGTLRIDENIGITSIMSIFRDGNKQNSNEPRIEVVTGTQSGSIYRFQT